MSAPAKKTVELFFDVISPYTWIGFEVLTRYQQKWNIDLQLKPFFLGGIMKGAENRPPGVVQAKAKYMMQDLKLLSQHYQLPLHPPSNPGEFMFVKGSLNTMRFLTAVHMTHPKYTEDLTREFFLRGWSRDEDISEAESIAEAARNVGLSDAVIADSLQKMKDPVVKDQLKANTEEALNYGAFGSPTIVAHVGNKAHMLFGSDRFPILADILENRAPAVVPAKAKYMFEDLAHLSRHYQLPLTPPSNPTEFLFVKGSISAMRFVTAVHMSHPKFTEDLSRELFMRGWSRDQDITQPESFAEAARNVGLSDAVIADSLQKMKDPVVKDQLKATTEEALNYGAFGAPTIIAHVGDKPVMIFGSDRFHILADILGEKYVGPLTELNKAKL